MWEWTLNNSKITLKSGDRKKNQFTASSRRKHNTRVLFLVMIVFHCCPFQNTPTKQVRLVQNAIELCYFTPGRSPLLKANYLSKAATDKRKKRLSTRLKFLLVFTRSHSYFASVLIKADWMPYLSLWALACFHVQVLPLIKLFIGEYSPRLFLLKYHQFLLSLLTCLFFSARIDGLVKREESPEEMTESYVDRDDFMYYRYETFGKRVKKFGPQEANSRPIVVR